MTTLIGIGGAILGGFVGRAIGIYHQGQGAGFLMSVLGQSVIYHAILGRRAA